MITQEQNYADYLYLLGDPALAAQSWVNIQQASPSNWQETDYYNYWFPLSPFDKGESEYLIFSDLYDRLDENVHDNYAFEFNAVNHSVDGLCSRRKEPIK